MTSKLFIRPHDPEISDPSVVGQKACDISTLPSCWVPNYFVISTKLFSEWEKKQNVEELFGDNELLELDVLLESVDSSKNHNLIFRSSSSDEDIRQRGKYLSVEIYKDGRDRNKLLSCISVIFEAFLKKTKTAGDEYKLALIVQEIKGKHHTGHLSNERRVARRIQDWVYEDDKIREVGNFAIKSHYQNAIPDARLSANNEAELKVTLRDIATYFDDLQQRRHIEWVWDRSHVWLVQGDRDINSVSKDPSQFLTQCYPIKSDFQFKILKHWSRVDRTKWGKITNQIHFEEAGLPTYPLWVLDDPDILNDIGRNSFPKTILGEIKQLAQYPIVIRTDVNKQNKQHSETLDLPHSYTLDSLNKIKEFISTNANNFLDHYDPNEFCFIFHQYIPCRSSALSLAKRDNPRVLIDSIWGIADGLQYFHHDEFEYDTSSNALVSDNSDYKEQYLAPNPNGDWEYVYSGPSYDWKRSLSNEEIQQISIGSIKLSKLLNKDLVTMWFVGIPENTDIPAVIPWWCGESRSLHGVDSPSDKSVFNREVVLISSLSDLNELESRTDGQGLALQLNPGPDLLRNKDFIEKIIQIAKVNDKPVEMCGSPLSHAYYLLQNAGIKVSCEPRLYRKSKILKAKVFKPRRFDKLVRDKIPQIISAHGEKASAMKIGKMDLVQALKRKAIEEAYEVFRAENEKHIKEELADLYEVIMAIARVYEITPEMIITLAKNKREAKGGFEDGMYLLQTVEIPLMPRHDTGFQFSADQLDLFSKIGTIPELQNNKLSIPLVPSPIQPINIKLPEHIAKCGDQSICLQIRYENTKILVEFLASSEIKQGSKLIDEEPKFTSD